MPGCHPGNPVRSQARSGEEYHRCSGVPDLCRAVCLRRLSGLRTLNPVFFPDRDLNEMSNEQQRRSIEDWNGRKVLPGERADLEVAIGQSYSGMNVHVPLHVWRGLEPGPVAFITAALHGDEINGTGAIRTLIRDAGLKLIRGSLILVPVINVLGFDRHSRYLPDRRDLNRCFPGTRSGSLASRMARTFFDEIVSRCDFGIDLHTASLRRTNFPNVRGDLSNAEVRRLAVAFGSEFIIDGAGPKGALRREACKAGCPTIILEAGEVWKVEPTIVQHAVRGITNVLAEFQMIDRKPVRPPFQQIIEKTKWLRAERGGFLEFHVSPGELVSAGQSIATNTSLLGQDQNVLVSPFDAVVIGMTTLPAVSPGEPVCNLGLVAEGMHRIERAREGLAEGHPHDQIVSDLATNLLVVEPPDSSSES